ncbi:MAG: hypothetical protein LBL47_04025 [Lactobacillus sp.]|jgi:hypothetical protein|nr:hypothetical protein [Lactobacillus sp.]
MKKKLSYILIAIALVFVQTSALAHSYHHHDCTVQHECEQCSFINHFSCTDASLNNQAQLPELRFYHEIALLNEGLTSLSTSSYHSQAPPLL